MTPMVTIAADDLTPPYEQLRRQFTNLIRSGALASGERLPPLRQLAADLGLAVGTVARTYRELEATGLIRTRRGGGTRVADHPRTLSHHQRQQQLDEHATTYIRQARLLDADHDAIIEAVRRALTTHHT